MKKKAIFCFSLFLFVVSDAYLRGTTTHEKELETQLIGSVIDNTVLMVKVRMKSSDKSRQFVFLQLGDNDDEVEGDDEEGDDEEGDEVGNDGNGSIAYDKQGRPLLDSQGNSRASLFVDKITDADEEEGESNDLYTNTMNKYWQPLTEFGDTVFDLARKNQSAEDVIAEKEKEKAEAVKYNIDPDDKKALMDKHRDVKEFEATRTLPCIFICKKRNGENCRATVDGQERNLSVSVDCSGDCSNEECRKEVPKKCKRMSQSINGQIEHEICDSKKKADHPVKYHHIHIGEDDELDEDHGGEEEEEARNDEEEEEEEEAHDMAIHEQRKRLKHFFHFAKVHSTCPTFPFCNHIPAPPPLLPEPDAIATPDTGAPIGTYPDFPDSGNSPVRWDAEKLPIEPTEAHGDLQAKWSKKAMAIEKQDVNPQSVKTFSPMNPRRRGPGRGVPVPGSKQTIAALPAVPGGGQLSEKYDVARRENERETRPFTKNGASTSQWNFQYNLYNPALGNIQESNVGTAAEEDPSHFQGTSSSSEGIAEIMNHRKEYYNDPDLGRTAIGDLADPPPTVQEETESANAPPEEFVSEGHLSEGEDESRLPLINLSANGLKCPEFGPCEWSKKKHMWGWTKKFAKMHNLGPNPY
eukprot:g1505.t1